MQRDLSRIFPKAGPWPAGAWKDPGITSPWGDVGKTPEVCHFTLASMVSFKKMREKVELWHTPVSHH